MFPTTWQQRITSTFWSIYNDYKPTAGCLILYHLPDSLEREFNCKVCQKHLINCNKDILPYILGKNLSDKERKEVFLKALVKRFPDLLLDNIFDMLQGDSL